MLIWDPIITHQRSTKQKKLRSHPHQPATPGSFAEMSTSLIMVVIVAYFGLLFIISHFTSRNAGNSAFFLGERRSPWYVVAFGMIGASLNVLTP
jgi:hypothetical protein